MPSSLNEGAAVEVHRVDVYLIALQTTERTFSIRCACSSAAEIELIQGAMTAWYCRVLEGQWNEVPLSTWHKSRKPHDCEGSKGNRSSPG